MTTLRMRISSTALLTKPRLRTLRRYLGKDRLQSVQRFQHETVPRILDILSRPQVVCQEAIKDTLHKNIGHLTEERTRIRRVRIGRRQKVSMACGVIFAWSAQGFPDRPPSAPFHWHRLPRCSWSEQGARTWSGHGHGIILIGNPNARVKREGHCYL